MFENAPQWMVVQGNVRRQQSERVILIGSDECQLDKLLLDLGNLPGDSSNEDKFQVHKEMIRPWKYLGEKLLPPH